MPVYDPSHESSLRVLSARATSPIEVNLRGIAEVINDLRFGSERERREQEQHEADMAMRRVKIGREENKLRLEKLKSVAEASMIVETIERSNFSPRNKSIVSRQATGILR